MLVPRFTKVIKTRGIFKIAHFLRRRPAVVFWLLLIRGERAALQTCPRVCLRSRPTPCDGWCPATGANTRALWEVVRNWIFSLSDSAGPARTDDPIHAPRTPRWKEHGPVRRPSFFRTRSCAQLQQRTFYLYQYIIFVR